MLGDLAWEDWGEVDERQAWLWGLSRKKKRPIKLVRAQNFPAQTANNFEVWAEKNPILSPRPAVLAIATNRSLSRAHLIYLPIFFYYPSFRILKFLQTTTTLRYIPNPSSATGGRHAPCMGPLELHRRPAPERLEMPDDFFRKHWCRFDKYWIYYVKMLE